MRLWVYGFMVVKRGSTVEFTPYPSPTKGSLLYSTEAGRKAGLICPATPKFCRSFITLNPKPYRKP